MDNMELERKFIPQALTDIPIAVINEPKIVIEQLYLVIGREEIRVRCSKYPTNRNIYSMTYKRYVERGIFVEHEIPIQQYAFNKLSIDRLPLRKDRRYFHVEHCKKASIDSMFNVDVAPHSLVEIEFNTAEEMKAFKPLSWFGEEVTGDFKYKNQYLWNALNGGRFVSNGKNEEY